MGAVELVEPQATDHSATPPAAVASGSSFYAAMRVLPRDQRDGMYEIYSFCRQVDDIADSDGPRAGRMEALDLWRRDIDAVYARPGDDAALPARLTNLARTVTRFALERDDFIAVIDGMEMDIVTTIVAPDAATLDLYCDRVASAVGRLSVRIFGMEEDAGRDLAHHLGRALQLTNILRDIDEDAAIGRVYLPRENLAAAGITPLTPESVQAHALDAVCAPLVAQARAHYDAARRIMAGSPRRAVIAPTLMADAYGALLDKIIARGFAPPRARVRVSRLRKARLVLGMAWHLLF